MDVHELMMKMKEVRGMNQKFYPVSGSQFLVHLG